MKRFTIFISTLLLAFISCSQPSKIDTVVIRTNVKQAAIKMGNFLFEKNYSEYLKYVHPKVIKDIGGDGKMIEMIKRAFQETDEAGILFASFNFGDASKIVSINKEVQTVLSQTIELKVDSGRVFSTSYLICISKDKGKTWVFYDTNEKTLKQLRKDLPSLSTELIIPRTAKPKFYRE